MRFKLSTSSFDPSDFPLTYIKLVKIFFQHPQPPLLAHCLAFFRMVPTAEMTVVLVPAAVVVTETTAGSVAVVVMMVGWARVTGIAESHLLFLF